MSHAMPGTWLILSIECLNRTGILQAYPILYGQRVASVRNRASSAMELANRFHSLTNLMLPLD
jgi:hypothetical protein